MADERKFENLIFIWLVIACSISCFPSPTWMKTNHWVHAVLDYVGFGTMQLRFTIFTKLFHSVQFSLLWSFLRKLLRRPLTATNKAKTEPFWLCFTHGLRLFPHNQAKPTVSSSCRRDDNRAVQGRVPFRVESAASGGKIKKYLAKSTA